MATEIETKGSAHLQRRIADKTLPLFVRKATSNRGKEVVHSTGRNLVSVDNRPAPWPLSLALAGKCPTIDEIQELLQSDRIPVAMILKKIEREQAIYGCTLGNAENLNKAGWKFPHIDSIGLKQRAELANIEIDKLETPVLGTERMGWLGGNAGDHRCDPSFSK